MTKVKYGLHSDGSHEQTVCLYSEEFNKLEFENIEMQKNGDGNGKTLHFSSLFTIKVLLLQGNCNIHIAK